VATVFDVGAHDGSSALKFAESFPSARVFAFEPASAAFRQLVAATERYPRIRAFQLAVAATCGKSEIYLTRHSTTSSLIRPEEVLGVEPVEVTTVDAFALAHGVDQVDLLKVDTEGLDLEVLAGAERMLDAGRTRFVIVETGLHPGDRRHVLFDEVRDFLVSRGFGVFGIYDQQLEWNGERRLRYINACFCHQSAT